MLFVLASTIYSGTSGSVTYSLSSNLPSDGWSSFIVLRHYETQGIETLTATDSDDEYLVEWTATDSAAWASGKYRAYYYAEKAGEKTIVCEQVVYIQVNPEGAVVKTDDQLELEKVNEAISGVLDGKGTKNYSFETSVGRRSAERMDLSELRAHKQWLERRIRSAEAKAQGVADPFGYRRIHTKFTR